MISSAANSPNHVKNVKLFFVQSPRKHLEGSKCAQQTASVDLSDQSRECLDGHSEK